jgi:hypothetical protein
MRLNSAIMASQVDYYICPDCGAEVRVGSRGCAQCLAWEPKRRHARPDSERKPWEQDEAYDGLDLPEEDFDREAWEAEEAGRGRKKTSLEWIWWTVALVLLLVLGALQLAGVWRR